MVRPRWGQDRWGRPGSGDILEVEQMGQVPAELKGAPKGDDDDDDAAQVFWFE